MMIFGIWSNAESSVYTIQSDPGEREGNEPSEYLVLAPAEPWRTGPRRVCCFG
jgi:hypothetical protein